MPHSLRRTTPLHRRPDSAHLLRLECPVIMHDVQLCSQCQSLLHRDRETSQRNYIGSRTHHTSDKSFQAALDLPCSICSLYWAERGICTSSLPSNIVCGIFSTDRFHGQELRFQWDSLTSPGANTISSLCLVPLDGTWDILTIRLTMLT